MNCAPQFRFSSVWIIFLAALYVNFEEFIFVLMYSICNVFYARNCDVYLWRNVIDLWYIKKISRNVTLMLCDANANVTN